jgi:hypothetical protein
LNRFPLPGGSELIEERDEDHRTVWHCFPVQAAARAARTEEPDVLDELEGWPFSRTLDQGDTAAQGPNASPQAEYPAR